MDTTREERAELAIESLTDSCRMIAEQSEGVREYSGFTAWLAPESFWYHRVRLFAHPPRGTERTVSEIADGIRSGELPPLLCWLDLDFPGTELTGLLGEAGFVPVTAQRAMYLSLQGRAAGKETPGQLRRMESSEIVEWAETNAKAFAKPPDTGGLRLLAERSGPETEFLVWEEDGRIAGGTLLCCSGSNAGIHEVFTLPEYRGRGIASALVSRALDDGNLQGCACATLQASEMGFPVYQKLGFEQVGTVHTWIRRPE